MVETIFKIIMICLVVSIVIGLVGTVFFAWNIDTSPYLQGLGAFLGVVLYIVPFAKLSPIVTVFIASMVFRIAISVIKTIWALLPVRA